MTGIRPGRAGRRIRLAHHGEAHGFGLRMGTAAGGWIDDAVEFWEKQVD